MEVMEGIVTAFEYFGRRAATGFVIPEWLPTPENTEYQEAVRSLDKTVYRIVADRRRALAAMSRPAGQEPEPKVICSAHSCGSGALEGARHLPPPEKKTQCRSRVAISWGVGLGNRGLRREGGEDFPARKKWLVISPPRS